MEGDERVYQGDHTNNVLEPHLAQALSEFAGIAVSGVGEHRKRRPSIVSRGSEQPQRNLSLFLERCFHGNLGQRASRGIVAPRLGKIELPPQTRTERVGDAMQRNDNLAVSNLCPPFRCQN